MADTLTAYTTTLQSGATATGNGTAANVGGFAAGLVELSGFGTGTITFEGCVVDTTAGYSSVLAYNLATGTWATTATAGGLYLVPLPGLSLFRARVSAYTSGTLVATLKGMGTGASPGVGTLSGLTKANNNSGLLVAPHNSDKATYVASFNVNATASVDLFAVESGASAVTRIRRIVITNPGAQTSAAIRSLTLIRTTAAGTGSTLTPAPPDSSDAAYSGIVRSGNTGANLGTAGTTLLTIPLLVPAAIATSQPLVFDFGGNGHQVHKCPTAPAGVTNGISLRDPGAAGGVTITGWVEFTSESA